MMKALVKTERAQGNVSLQEMPIPEPAEDEVRIRVKAASICGSDLHAYQYDPSYSFISVPVILGHELSGVVDAVGKQVNRMKVGDRVIVEANTHCGTCAHCTAGDTHICEKYQVQGLHVNGGFAEYFCTHQKHVHQLPSSIDLDTASITEPLAVAVHAVYDRSNITSGQSVAVFGPGPIGLLTAQVIATKGAVPILFGIDSDEQSRLPVGRSLGIRSVNLMQETIADVLDELKIEAFDHVIDCSGSNAALKSGLDVLKKGGQLTLVGLFPSLTELDLSLIVRREINVVGSYACKPENYKQAIELLAEGKIKANPLHTIYRLEQHEEAFQDALAKKAIKPLFIIS